MATAEELTRSLLKAAEQGFPSTTADLYLPDARVNVVFEPGPSRSLGRSDLAARFAAAAGNSFRLSVENLVLHHTTDPHVVIAEYQYRWTRPADIGGREFSTRNIQVIEERDGRIGASRDYHDHARINAGLHG